MSGTATTSAWGGLDRIYDNIEVVLPGILHSIVKMALWNAIEEFCYRSTYYRQTVSWGMAAGTQAIDLTVVDDLTLATKILWVRGSRFVQIKPPAVLISRDDFSMARTGTALLLCKPNALTDLVPSFLIDNWNEALVNGAMGRLLGMPSKPWTDSKLAIYHLQRFRSQIGLAREEARLFGDYDTWKFPYFARGRQVSSIWGAGDPLLTGGVPVDRDLPMVDGILVDADEDIDGGVYFPTAIEGPTQMLNGGDFTTPDPAQSFDSGTFSPPQSQYPVLDGETMNDGAGYTVYDAGPL